MPPWINPVKSVSVYTNQRLWAEKTNQLWDYHSVCGEVYIQEREELQRELVTTFQLC